MHARYRHMRGALVFLSCLIIGMLGLTTVVWVAAAPPTGPTITWTPTTVVETIAVGDRRTVAIALTATEPLSQVAVRIVPELAPYVQVTPSTFGSVAAGQPIALTLTLTAAATAQPGLVQGPYSYAAATATRAGHWRNPSQ